MATTTPNFGWPVPTSTDLVKDGATAIEALGDAIDASMTDLRGGTTGQVLAKATNADMDFTWVVQDDSNAIQNTIVDAKGDLIAASAADTPARLAVGNNGETLIADSTAATGLKWAKSANFVGCSVYKSASVSIANATDTLLTFDSENFDTDAFHSTSTNTSRITIPTGLGGKYLVNISARWGVSLVGERRTRIYKNGASIVTSSGVGSGEFPTFSKSLILNLVAGDYLELYVFQTSGAALDYFGRDEEQPFQVQYLGA